MMCQVPWLCWAVYREVTYLILPMHLQKSPGEVPIDQESDMASHIISKWQNQDVNSRLSYWKVTMNHENEDSKASLHSYNHQALHTMLNLN